MHGIEEIASARCSSVTGSLGLAKIFPKSEKAFEAIFVAIFVAIQNSLDWFRNTLNVGNNSKTSRWFSIIWSAASCNWHLAVTEESFGIAICL